MIFTKIYNSLLLRILSFILFFIINSCITKRSSFIFCYYRKLRGSLSPIPILSQSFGSVSRCDKMPGHKKRTAIFTCNLLRFDLSVLAVSASSGSRCCENNIRTFFSYFVFLISFVFPLFEMWARLDIVEKIFARIFVIGLRTSKPHYIRNWRAIAFL